MEELVKSLQRFRPQDRSPPSTSGVTRSSFLTRTGQKCTSSRQEFILLSDGARVSMLVDAVNHRERDGRPPETDRACPFYVGEHKPMPHGADISADLPGERNVREERVTDLMASRLRRNFQGRNVWARR